MLSCGILIRTHDDHHIFDRSTHERINALKDVIIGHHVWVGYHTMRLAGMHIGKGSIIGAGAVTSSGFGEYVLAAGCPAKVMREDVAGAGIIRLIFSGAGWKGVWIRMH